MPTPNECRWSGLHCATMPFAPLTISVVNPVDDDLGFVAHLAVGPDRIVGVGGTSSPVVLLSSTGRGFTPALAPERGLRCAVFGDDWVAVVGEYGTVAVAEEVDILASLSDDCVDEDEGWLSIDADLDGCAYYLGYGPDGLLWVTGDNGYCARILGSGGNSDKFWRASRIPLDFDGRVFTAQAIGEQMFLGLDDGRLAVVHGSGDGDTVEYRHTGARAPLTTIVSTPTGTVVLAGDNGFLARSTDHGLTFTRVESGTPVAIEDLTVLADGRLVAVGGRGVVLVSDDDGVSFASVDSGVSRTLWCVTPFGPGALIGGDDGLVLRFAPDDDDTWADRPDVFGGPRTLDAAFEGGPEGFLGERLAAYLEAVGPRPPTDEDESPEDEEPAVGEEPDDELDDEDNRDPIAAKEGMRAYRLLRRNGDANDFQAVWGAPMPAEYAEFRAATTPANVWSTFDEFRLNADLLPDVPAEENLFELVVLRDQQAYLGTGLAEVFGGVFHIGSQGNGDSYHLAVYAQPRDSGHTMPRQVLHYDHEEHRFSDIFADELSSLVYLSALEGAQDRRLISRDCYTAGLRSLYGKVDPTWHFSIGSKDPDFVRLEQYASLPEYLFFRSRWIQTLLKNDRVYGVKDAPSYFADNLNPIITADVAAARLNTCTTSVPTALYSMWRAFLFDEPTLDDYLRVCATVPARLTRDCARLIEELRAGTRTRLGSISDVPAWLAQIRALDLDPRRADDRAREAEQAARRDAEHAMRIAAELADLNPADPSDLAEFAQRSWVHLDDAIYHRQVLAALRRDPARAEVVDRVFTVAAMYPDARRKAARLLAPGLDPVLEVLLVGALVRGDQSAEPQNEQPQQFHALGVGELLQVRAAAGLADRRVAAALRPLLAVEEEYNHRRQVAVRVLGALCDRESIPALIDMIINTPILDMLDSVGKEDLLIEGARALGAMPDPAAIPALTSLVTPKQRYYDKVRSVAASALAACRAASAEPAEIDDDVLDQLLHTIASDIDADDIVDAHVAYGQIARGLDPQRRVLALAKLTATPSNRDDLLPRLARAVAIHFASTGSDPGSDIASLLNEALTTRDWNHDYTVKRLTQALRIAADFPDLVEASSLTWLTRFDEAELRGAAHDLLAAIGTPLDPAPVFDDVRARALSDTDLVAAISDPHLVGRAALIIEASHRGLTDAWPAIISAVNDVAARTDHRSPLNQDRAVVDAAVAAMAAGPLTEEVITCLDALLRHPHRDMKWDLMRCAPHDPRLIDGMRYVAAEKWGWQESAALDWLAQVGDQGSQTDRGVH